MSDRQKIVHFIAMVVGATSIFLFFRGDLLWPSIGIMTMGIICAFSNKAGGELNVVIGLILILLYFEQRILLVLLSLILMVVGLYDLLVIIEIKNNLTGEDKKQRGQEFLTEFSEKELVRVLCVKLVRLLGFKK